MIQTGSKPCLSDKLESRRREVMVKSESDFDMPFRHQDKARRIDGRELMKLFPGKILPGGAHLFCVTGDNFKVGQLFQRIFPGYSDITPRMPIKKSKCLQDNRHGCIEISTTIMYLFPVRLLSRETDPATRPTLSSPLNRQKRPGDSSLLIINCVMLYRGAGRHPIPQSHRACGNRVRTKPDLPNRFTHKVCHTPARALCGFPQRFQFIFR